jgi:undecaprenyl diphosphate synthase
MVSFDKIPTHVAVIMDGNGRWAKRRGLPRIFGHRQGVNTLKKVCDYSIKYGVKYLTLYAFSTENWKRPEEELSGLMKLFREFLTKEAENLLKKGIKLVVSGRYKEFDADIVERVEKLCKDSEKNDRLVLNIALNYGGRAEIIDAFKKAFDSDVKIEKEEDLRRFLYHPEIPDPDILVRTSGEYRISNFLLWEIAYSELYFTEKYWPDFDEKEFVKMLEEYSKRERRFGGV